MSLFMTRPLYIWAGVLHREDNSTIGLLGRKRPESWVTTFWSLRSCPTVVEFKPRKPRDYLQLRYWLIQPFVFRALFPSNRWDSIGQPWSRGPMPSQSPSWHSMKKELNKIALLSLLFHVIHSVYLQRYSSNDSTAHLITCECLPVGSIQSSLFSSMPLWATGNYLEASVT